MLPRAAGTTLALAGMVLVAMPASTGASDTQALLYTAYRSGALELRAISPDGTRARTIAKLGDRFTYGVTLSPNDQAAAVFDDAGLSVIDLRNGSRRVVARDSAVYTWAPDSKRIAYLTTKRIAYLTYTAEVAVVRIDGSGRKRLAQQRARRTWLPFAELAWSPDGKRVAFANWQAYDSRHPPVGGRIGTVTMSGKQTLLQRIRPFVPASLAWSPNSKAVAAGGFRDAGVIVVRLERAKPRYLRGTDCCVGVTPSWSPDGKRLAFLGGDTSLSYAGGVITLAGQRATVFKQFDGARHAVWASDSRHFAFVGCFEGDKEFRCDVYVSDGEGRVIERVEGTSGVQDLLRWSS
jgi:Tol biopolymer transport system component